MLLRLMSIPILAIALSACSSVVREADVVGTYKICLMACKIIEIRPDHTFRYVAMTDVGTPPEVEGEWRLLDNGLVEAESYDQPTSFPHTESIDPEVDGVLVRVSFEEQDFSFAGVTVAYSDGSTEVASTDQTGWLRFPPGSVRQIRVDPGVLLQGFMGAYNGAVYEIRNSEANTFELEFMWVPFYLNELWLIQKNQLYTVTHFAMEKAE